MAGKASRTAVEQLPASTRIRSGRKDCRSSSGDRLDDLLEPSDPVGEPSASAGAAPRRRTCSRDRQGTPAKPRKRFPVERGRNFSTVRNPLEAAASAQGGQSFVDERRGEPRPSPVRTERLRARGTTKVREDGAPSTPNRRSAAITLPRLRHRGRDAEATLRRAAARFGKIAPAWRSANRCFPAFPAEHSEQGLGRPGMKGAGSALFSIRILYKEESVVGCRASSGGVYSLHPFLQTA